MTRLYYEIIREIPNSLHHLDAQFRTSTGLDLLGVASRAAGIDRAAALQAVGRHTAAVIPVTSGQGVITGFTNAVQAILDHIGMKSYITDTCDVAGLGEAFSRKADLVFMADDNKFLGLNLRNLLAIDNARATAEGFVHALAAAAELSGRDLRSRQVLVLGLGPVGMHAVPALKKLGAVVWVYDIDPGKMVRCTEMHPEVAVFSDTGKAFKEFEFIIDATPAEGFIDLGMIGEGTVISCPGVPHGLAPALLNRIGSGLIHDNLPLGVATMAVQGISISGH